MLFTKTPELEKVSEIIKLADKPKLNENEIKVIDETMRKSLYTIGELLAKKAEAPKTIAFLTDDIISLIKNEDWYLLLFHFVSIELNKGKGSMTYLLLTIVERFASVHPEIKRKIETLSLSTVDIVDIVYNSDARVYAGVIALESLLVKETTKEK